MDSIRIGYPAGYLRFFWIGIGFGYLFLKKNGSGQDQDFCLISITKFSWEQFKKSQMIVVGSVFLTKMFYFCQKFKMISSVCAALRPVTSLGHQEGRRVFRDGPKFFELCPIFLNFVQHISSGVAKNFLGGAWHPWLWTWLRSSQSMINAETTSSIRLH